MTRGDGQPIEIKYQRLNLLTMESPLIASLLPGVHVLGTVVEFCCLTRGDGQPIEIKYQRLHLLTME